MADSQWRNPSSKRGAVVRIALFVAMYVALEYMLDIVFFGLFGGHLGSHKNAGELLGTLATLIAALLAGGVLITVIDQRPLGALGYAWTSHTPREIGAGLALGGGANALGAAMLLVIGALTYTHDAGTIASWCKTIAGDFVIFAIAAAAEETVFRGYAFQVLVRAFGPYVAVFGASAMFAAAHLGNPNVTVFALVNIFLAGVLLGLAYLRTMSLWFATAVHAGWNWMMASALDLPVSGLNMFQTPLYEPVQHGAKWVGGGTFGPEGGIAGTVGFAIALVVLIKFMRTGVAPEMAALKPIAGAVNE